MLKITNYTNPYSTTRSKGWSRNITLPNGRISQSDYTGSPKPEPTQSSSSNYENSEFGEGYRSLTRQSQR